MERQEQLSVRGAAGLVTAVITATKGKEREREERERRV